MPPSPEVIQDCLETLHGRQHCSADRVPGTPCLGSAKSTSCTRDAAVACGHSNTVYACCVIHNTIPHSSGRPSRAASAVSSDVHSISYWDTASLLNSIIYFTNAGDLSELYIYCRTD